MLSVKQGGIKYHFLSLWYDSTRDWTPVSRGIGEHSNYKANGPETYKNNRGNVQFIMETLDSYDQLSLEGYGTKRVNYCSTDKDV